ncbi:ubiquinone biosynthesis protein COQ7-domain-containing protein [Paraphysoderma sedebokerense]|nr:ubiquinone biosynthesis protein COQ7-domain-containing protein [Paraphysoderma sedebokerense]
MFPKRTLLSTLVRNSRPICIRHYTRNSSTNSTNPPNPPPPNSKPQSHSKGSKPIHLTPSQHALISRFLRVNQSGEIGANTIYQGQHFVLSRTTPSVAPLIQHMWDQEVHHLNTFNHLIPKFRVRPSLLTPVWNAAGFALGCGTALLGKEAAMACTEAVETVIGRHYNDQLRELVKLLDDPSNKNIENRKELEELAETIKKFRDDELEHHDTALEHDAAKAPLYNVLKTVIMGGCKGAIWVAERV